MDERVEILHSSEVSRNTLYLMQRDQRVQKNHSFNLAYKISLEKRTNFIVGMYLKMHKMNQIQEYFMLNGIPSLNNSLKTLNVPLIIIDNLYETIKILNIDSIVVEFSPLKESLAFHKELLGFCQSNNIALHRCDSHNIVPCRLLKTYLKTPFAVKTELKRHFERFDTPYHKIEMFPYNKDDLPESEHFHLAEMHPRALIYLHCKFESGCDAAQKTLDIFLSEKLKGYKKYRNNADKNFQSDLSPYLHFGQISPHHVVTEALKYREKLPEDVDCFISEVFHWREIAEHFCLHEKNYDNIKGAPQWAIETLKKHGTDTREYVYSLEQLISANTHDKEWNAAQNQLASEHKIHGYVRMFWAKSLIKWTPDAETALSFAIHLNDSMSIDGNDPNGYLGIMWSIFGALDKPFPESEYFGTVRMMKGIRAKNYTEKWNRKSSILNFL